MGGSLNKDLEFRSWHCGRVISHLWSGNNTLRVSCKEIRFYFPHATGLVCFVVWVLNC